MRTIKRLVNLSTTLQIDCAVFAELQLIPGRTSEGSGCRLSADSIKSNYDNGEKMKEQWKLLASRSTRVKCNNKQEYGIMYTWGRPRCHVKQTLVICLDCDRAAPESFIRVHVLCAFVEISSNLCANSTTIVKCQSVSNKPHTC